MSKKHNPIKLFKSGNARQPFKAPAPNGNVAGKAIAGTAFAKYDYAKSKPAVYDTPLPMTGPAHLHDLETLLKIRRPSNGHGEEALREYIKTRFSAYEDLVVGVVENNLIVDVGPTEPCLVLDDEPNHVFGGHMPLSRTIFSSHLDTVHRGTGYNGVRFDEMRQEFSTTFDNNDCLGADDGAGIWVMLHMIEARVHGRYIFHVGEECGGIGSRALAEKYPDLLTPFDRAIAFDRKGTTDIITHQGFGMGGYCASDEFAKALGEALHEADVMLNLSGSSHGVFTDTANYVDLIAECTNLSVGYEGAHTSSERLDTLFLERLKDACCTINWEALPTVRKAGEQDTVLDSWDDDDWRLGSKFYSSAGLDDDMDLAGYSGFERLVRIHPELAVECLDACGIDVHEFRQIIKDSSTK